MHVRARHRLEGLLRQERAALRLRARQPRSPAPRLRHQGDTGARGRRGGRQRLLERPQRPRQGAEPHERGSQVAG